MVQPCYLIRVRDLGSNLLLSLVKLLSVPGNAK